MNIAAWIAYAALTANTAVVASDLHLFLWDMRLENPDGLILVTIRPMPLGLVLGLDVKAIAIKPIATSDDPSPGLIEPVRTEVTDRFARAAWFKPVGRRFHLFVTFRDGSTRTVDPWGFIPIETLKSRTRPAVEIAGQVKRG